MMAKMTPQFTTDSPRSRNRSSREAKTAPARETGRFASPPTLGAIGREPNLSVPNRPLSGLKRPYWGTPQRHMETQNPGFYGKFSNAARRKMQTRAALSVLMGIGREQAVEERTAARHSASAACAGCRRRSACRRRRLNPGRESRSRTDRRSLPPTWPPSS